MNWINKQNEVVEVANSLVGIKEIGNNAGWTYPERPEIAKKYTKDMKSDGWKLHQAWCAYNVEVIWSRVYDGIDNYKYLLDKLFSGSAVRTLEKFKKHGWNTGNVPVIGSVVIWQQYNKGKATSRGHAGIVTSFNDKNFKTVEGNTNAAGSREGQEIAKKTRKFDFDVETGLRVVGFIYPPNISPLLPFKDKTAGDAFRVWVNENHPETASRIDLDRSGSWFNSYILEAWNVHQLEYTVNHL